MPEIDEFASSLLEESKRFLEKANMAEDNTAVSAYLHAALMMAFCSLEAHVNAVCEEMAKRTEAPHERSILLERDVKLVDGAYKLQNGLKIFRLEDRLEFLIARFGTKKPDSSEWKAELSSASSLRNNLTHAKNVPSITNKSVTKAVESVIRCLDVLYQAIYGRVFPPVRMGLDSELNF